MMTCSICRHPRRNEIEAAFIHRVSYRRIASQFGCGYRSIPRHMFECIPRAIQAEQRRLAWKHALHDLAMRLLEGIPAEDIETYRHKREVNNGKTKNARRDRG
jgi:hypothetical protein